MARLTREEVDRYRMPMEPGGTFFDPEGLVDPRALESMVWGTSYDKEARQREIDAMRNKLAAAVVAREMMSTQANPAGASRQFYPTDGGGNDAGVNAGTIPGGSPTTSAPLNAVEQAAVKAGPFEQGKPTDIISPAPQPSQPDPTETGQPAPGDFSAAPATGTPTGALNAATDISGPGFSTGPATGGGLAAATGITGPTGAPATGAPATGTPATTDQAAPAPPGYNVDAASQQAATMSGMPGIGLVGTPATGGRAAVQGAGLPSGLVNTASQVNQSTKGDPQAQPAPPAPPDEVADPGAKTNVTMSQALLDFAQSVLAGRPSNPSTLAEQNATEAGRAAAVVADMNANNALSNVNAPGFLANVADLSAVIQDSDAQAAQNAQSAALAAMNVDPGTPATALASPMGMLMSTVNTDFNAPGPFDTASPTNNPAQNAITDALNAAALNQNAPPSFSIHSPAPSQFAPTDESTEADADSAAAAAAVAAAMGLAMEGGSPAGDTGGTMGGAPAGIGIAAEGGSPAGDSAGTGQSGGVGVGISSEGGSPAGDSAGTGQSGGVGIGISAEGGSPGGDSAGTGQSGGVGDGAGGGTGVGVDAGGGGITGGSPGNDSSGGFGGGIAGEGGPSGSLGGSPGGDSQGGPAGLGGNEGGPSGEAGW